MEKEVLKVNNEETIEQNPSKFKQLADSFVSAMKNPNTIVSMVQGLGAVPSAVATIGSIMSGNVPVAVGAGLVTCANVLGGMLKEKTDIELEMA